MEKIYLNENLRKRYEKKSLEKAKEFELNKIILKWELLFK